MHLLAAQPGVVSDGTEAIDLAQTPGDIVVLSAADSELASLAAARARLGDGVPSVRLANLLHLGHNMSVDLYVDAVVRHARLVVVRLLGGRGYWDYGVEQVAAACREGNIPVAFLPGDDQPDAELAGLSTLDAEAGHRLWQYCVHGGPDNAAHFLGYAAPSPRPRRGMARTRPPAARRALLAGSRYARPRRREGRMERQGPGRRSCLLPGTGAGGEPGRRRRPHRRPRCRRPQPVAGLCCQPQGRGGCGDGGRALGRGAARCGAQRNGLRRLTTGSGAPGNTVRCRRLPDPPGRLFRGRHRGLA